MLDGEALWDRVAGSLHGLLIGDALGCPVEGWTAAQIAAEFGRLDRMAEVAGPSWRPAGLHSDDGQQALAVLDAICRDPERPELRFVDLMIALRDAAPQRGGRWGLHRAVGRNFRQTIRGFQSTGSQDPYAHATPTAGNGAAMRVAPVALWWRDDPKTRDLRAASISAVTHADLRGIAAAQALAIAITRALTPTPVPVLGIRLVDDLEQAEQSAAALLGHEHDRRFSRLLRALVEHRRHCYDLGELLAGIAERARTIGGAARMVEATSGFAPCSVLAALAIVDFAQSFEEALTLAVNLGGDTDTIGAMVGALAGARFGLTAIPTRWLDDLRATGTLMSRIDQVVARETGDPLPDLIALETEWDALFEQRI
ncbi:MAG TPA: ADP-ribosylglycohydrolase family protein [Enhygromyxa sp.]|nr:ADP-ribosylglycohydrolase family protein [Enhygromyxa sp.]